MDSNLNIYHKLLLLMMQSKHRMADIMEHRQMTPVQGMLLMLFEPGIGKSMQELSRQMSCDASNMTGLIDRLGAQQLIDRTTDPSDRRVKVIKLSQKGIDCKREVLEALRQSEAVDMQRLTSQEKKEFITIVQKITSEA